MPLIATNKAMSGYFFTGSEAGKGTDPVVLVHDSHAEGAALSENELTNLI